MMQSNPQTRAETLGNILIAQLCPPPIKKITKHKKPISITRMITIVGVHSMC